MCGLTGLFTRRDTSSLPTDISRMAATIEHRGPDDSGTWCDGADGIAFGFRRLAILDLSQDGHQPMESAGGRYVIVFNGEIYNYLDLRADLEKDGVAFRGTSDTEVILAAVERDGVEATLPRLNGMFAIALWDRSERRLHLARDPIGIKPMFVQQSDGRVTFGSELKTLVAAPGFQGRIDMAGLGDFLRYMWIPAPRTIYQGVRKLEPGHLLTIEDPSASLPASTSFWDLDSAVAAGEADPFEGSDDEAVEALDGLLRDAVLRQMQSDVPLGAFLSGGIDSSTVVSLMQAQSRAPVNTFTIGFDGGEFDESNHARAVAEHLGTNHTSVHVTGREALDVVPLLAEMFDEPFADPSQIPTYLVSALARKHVTVALSGDGGDEVFSGYNRYIAGERVAGRMERIPAIARRAASAGLAALPASGWDRAASVASAVAPRLGVRLAGDKVHKISRMLRTGDEVGLYRSLLATNDDADALLASSVVADDLPTAAVGSRPPAALLERMMRADQGHYLPDDLLAKTDRASMAVSLEVRVPLLDTRVVELGWRLPRALRVRNGKGKWLLRQVLHRYVPREIVERPKMGFSVPIGSWLRGDLRPWADDLVRGSSVADELDRDAVLRAWDAVQGRNSSNTADLAMWALCMYLAWRERWA